MANRKSKRRSIYSQFVPIFAWLSLVAAFGFGLYQNQQGSQLLPLFPAQQEQLGNNQGDMVPPDQVIFPQGPGYRGPFVLMMELVEKEDGTYINKLNILSQKETPKFFALLIRGGFFQQYIGKEVNDAFRMHRDVDNVTGASVSARAFNFAIEEAIARQTLKPLKEVRGNYLKKYPHMADQLNGQVNGQDDKAELSKNAAILASLSDFEAQLKEQFYLAEGFILIVALLVIIESYVKGKIRTKIRNALPWLSLIILGFYLNMFISISTLAGLFLGYIPDFNVFGMWWVLVVPVVFFAVIVGKNIYCNKLCPYQALETVLRKLTKNRWSLAPEIAKHARQLALVLTWFALMLIFISQDPGIGSYEPFESVFSLDAQGSALAILVLALIGMLLYPGFWCRTFCPVGLTLDETIKVRKQLVNGISSHAIRIGALARQGSNS